MSRGAEIGKCEVRTIWYAGIPVYQEGNLNPIIHVELLDVHQLYTVDKGAEHNSPGGLKEAELVKLQICRRCHKRADVRWEITRPHRSKYSRDRIFYTCTHCGREWRFKYLYCAGEFFEVDRPYPRTFLSDPVDQAVFRAWARSRGVGHLI